MPLGHTRKEVAGMEARLEEEEEEERKKEGGGAVRREVEETEEGRRRMLENSEIKHRRTLWELGVWNPLTQPKHKIFTLPGQCRRTYFIKKKKQPSLITLSS